MIAPPPNVELLLASLGAEPDLCDAVIGDLAEEFVYRAETDGVDSADRWYYREALRAAPHLAYNSLRHRGFLGLFRSIGTVLTAYTVVLFAAIPPVAIIGGVALRVGALRPRTAPLPATGHLAILPIALWLTVDLLVFSSVGYVAAYLDEDAPLTSATLSGLGAAIFGSVVVVAGVLRTPSTVPFQVWFSIVCVAVAAIIGGSIVGGVLRVRAANNREVSIEVSA